MSPKMEAFIRISPLRQVIHQVQPITNRVKVPRYDLGCFVGGCTLQIAGFNHFRYPKYQSIDG